MQNTTRLYEAINRYMTERAEAREEFALMQRRNEKARGSRLYDEALAEAKAKRERRVADAQTSTRQEMAAIVRDMTKKAEAVKMTPPTDEQMRILSLLKMRDHLTQAELDSAAHSMDGNGAALGVLDELARKHEILVQPYSKLATAGLTAEQSKAAIRDIVNACNEIVSDKTGARRPALMAAEYHAHLYGSSFDADELAQEPLFENEADFYESVSPVSLALFSKAVD